MTETTTTGPPRINVQLVTDEEQDLIYEARVVAAALGEPLRALLFRAVANELRRQRDATPDLLQALDRLRAERNGAPGRA